MRLLALLVGSILTLLAALHLYWALGGRWSLGAAVPELDGRATIRPGPLACSAVAALLLAAALLLLGRGGVVSLPLPRWLVIAGTWTVGLVFVLRAIGDFRFFGLFRHITRTTFARNDALLYTPLCLLLAAGSFVVAWRGAAPAPAADPAPSRTPAATLRD
jgi:hypothetical protein